MFVALLRCIFWRLVQYLSHSIIHPVQERPWFQRKVAFSGCVRVHIIDISDELVCVLGERRSTHVLASNISSDFHSWEDHLSSMFHSDEFDELRSIWLSYLVFPGLSDAVEASTFGSLMLHRETKFIIGFDFAVTLSSPASSCVLFDIASGPLMELTWNMIPFITCEISLCQYICEWVLVSVYLIWILGSKLILTNNQSSATLWVLETCLIVGLLPFMIILITASLSSNTYNKASWCEDWTFEENQHCLDHQSFHEISFALEICAGLPVLD